MKPIHGAKKIRDQGDIPLFSSERWFPMLNLVVTLALPVPDCYISLIGPLELFKDT